MDPIIESNEIDIYSFIEYNMRCTNIPSIDTNNDHIKKILCKLHTLCSNCDDNIIKIYLYGQTLLYLTDLILQQRLSQNCKNSILNKIHQFRSFMYNDIRHEQYYRNYLIPIIDEIEILL